MNRTRTYRPALYTLGALAALVVAITRVFAHPGEDHGAAAPAAPAPTTAASTGGIHVAKEQQFALGMLTEPAARRSLQQSVNVTGQVVPRTDAVAEVVPPVAGQVVAGNVPRLGDRVSRGQVLFRIAQVLSPSERTALRGEQIRARAELQSAEREVSRLERLEGVVAGKQTTEARIRRDAARQTLQAIDAQLSGSGTSVAVTAPISGVITSANLVGGEVLDGSRVVYEIADLSRVWIQANVFESDVERVSQAQRAEIRVPSYPTETFTGTLYKLGSQVDPGTRTVQALFVVDNANEKLKLNMSASVAVVTANVPGILALPRGAIVESGARRVVFVHTTPEEFAVRDVTLGPGTGGGYVQIAGGLNEGDRVLTTNTVQMKSLAGL